MAPLIKVAAKWVLRRHNSGNPVLYTLYQYDDDLLSLLTEAMQADDEDLRAAAAICAGEMNDARAYPALHAAQSDPSANVRAAAQDALERMKRRSSSV
jgi:HEAT repeat protein